MRQMVMSQTEAAFPSKFDILNGDMHFQISFPSANYKLL